MDENARIALLNRIRERRAAPSPEPDFVLPPEDWSDIKGWDRYLASEITNPPYPLPSIISPARFLNHAKTLGKRIWFPGCGLDVSPRFYACVGFDVVATDFSPVAVKTQREFSDLSPEKMFQNWSLFIQKWPQPPAHGCFMVQEQDFTTAKPDGTFDAVINCRAFQGLSPSRMSAAARHYFAALRPGGAAFIDTINVQGRLRDVLEDSLAEAGFFLPYLASERWYRDQLEGTGIPYNMVLGRPLVLPREEDREARQRVLASFRPEYEKRIQAEKSSVKAALAKPTTTVAYVVYVTG